MIYWVCCERTWLACTTSPHTFEINCGRVWSTPNHLYLCLTSQMVLYPNSTESVRPLTFLSKWMLFKMAGSSLSQWSAQMYTCVYQFGRVPELFSKLVERSSYSSLVIGHVAMTIDPMQQVWLKAAVVLGYQGWKILTFRKFNPTVL